MVNNQDFYNHSNKLNVAKHHYLQRLKEFFGKKKRKYNIQIYLVLFLQWTSLNCKLNHFAPAATYMLLQVLKPAVSEMNETIYNLVRIILVRKHAAKIKFVIFLFQAPQRQWDVTLGGVNQTVSYSRLVSIFGI